MKNNINLLDCTLRDGGYYNSWDFDESLVKSYLKSMDDLKVDFVEIGFRSIVNNSYKGPFAYSSDEYLENLDIPIGLKGKIGVMINGSEISDKKNQNEVLTRLFKDSNASPVTLVRIACHFGEFVDCLPASEYLKKKGYLVGFNIMQVADRTEEDIISLASEAAKYPIDVLYFADSMGSLTPEGTRKIVKAFQNGWNGELGIHTHDNMGNAVANTLEAIKSGTSWVDSTVTGMGRGPGNAQTEYLALELETFGKELGDASELYSSIREHFSPLQKYYEWGKNTYYYLAGKYSIHPTYIQSMLKDKRYSDEDLISVIEYLKKEGGKSFRTDTLETARQFFSGKAEGDWNPKKVFDGKSVLIIGPGPSTKKYKKSIESFIRKKSPHVIGLNTVDNIDQSLIGYRASCHPVRLMADTKRHLNFPQPLITPFSLLSADLKKVLKNKTTLNYGLTIEKDNFQFNNTDCVIPNPLVFSYILAMLNSGNAENIYLVGFDGFEKEDERTNEMRETIDLYHQYSEKKFISLTPTNYNIETKSIFSEM